MERRPRHVMVGAAELKQALSWAARGDTTRSMRELEALALRAPDDATLQNALGSMHGAAGDSDAALLHFRRALALQPSYLAAQVNLGTTLLEQGQLHESVELLEAAVTQPDAPAAAEQSLGRVLCLLGRQAEAQLAFERALSRKHAHAGTVSQRCYSSLLDPALDARAIVDIHTRSVSRLHLGAAKRFANDRNTARKLRVGYVSADFRAHSVACFLEGVLAAHDRDAVEVELYSDVPRQDTISTRLYASADRVHHCQGRSHAELAALCESARVDVLIDLAGHMQPNRLPVFLARAAPVQFTYLGYPGSTGAPCFSARLTDVWADPDARPEIAGPEPLEHIPGGYLAYAPPNDAPDVSPLPAASADHVTFGCFADAVKLNPRVLQIWAELLQRCPNARLLLKSRMFSSPDYRRHITSTLSAHGADPRRIELLPFTATRREHLAHYARVDIGLDTFPYAGATTSCEALWMGVPVITLAGDHHAARLGVSVLSAAGYERGIARNLSDYVARALELASDVPVLARLRAALRPQLLASGLCECKRVTRAIERAAREHFARWAASEA